MMAELLALLSRATCAGSLAVAAVMLLRLPARRWLGAEAAYGLWAAPAAAVVLSAIPWPFRTFGIPSQGFEAPLWLGGLWATGAVFTVLLAWRAQAAFERQARAGRAGPAVVGVLCPRVVMPPSGYTEAERALVRAHEREHIARGDPRANGVLLLMQVAFWFNPLAHLAARLMRLDQELACDAGALRRLGGQKRPYAETLLRTHMAGALPLGCRWPAPSRHPLEIRVAALGRAGEPQLLAKAVVAVFVAAIGIAALVAKPAVQARPMEWPRSPSVVMVDMTPR